MLDLVHLCGLVQTSTVGGKKHFVTFVDDCSCLTVIFLITRKGDVCVKLKEFVAATKNKFKRKIKTLRID